MGELSVIGVGTLRKSVGAIHIIADHSLVERKVFNSLLKNALPEIRTSNKHRIAISEIARAIGANTKNLDIIKEAIIGLMSKPVQWNVLDDGEGEWEATTCLAAAKVSRGVCTYEYSNMLIDRLADPEIYSLIDLRMQQLFTSRFALNVYENCQRFVGVGSTGWWDLDTFRGVAGANSESHASFKFLRRDVIDMSIREINEVSDIEIEVEYKKIGRAVSDLRFKVRPNRRGQLFLGEPSELARSTPAYVDLTALGMSDKAATKAIELYDEGYLFEKVVLTRRMIKEGKVNDAGAYLTAAIRDDYALAPEVKLDIDAVAVIEARRASEAIEDQAAEQAIATEKAERKRVIGVIMTALSDMDDDKSDEVVAIFSEDLAPAHRQLFKTQGFGVLPIAVLSDFARQLEGAEAAP